jgi:hypothetical protein
MSEHLTLPKSISYIERQKRKSLFHNMYWTFGDDNEAEIIRFPHIFMWDIGMEYGQRKISEHNFNRLVDNYP